MISLLESVKEFGAVMLLGAAGLGLLKLRALVRR